MSFLIRAPLFDKPDLIDGTIHSIQQRGRAVKTSCAPPVLAGSMEQAHQRLHQQRVQAGVQLIHHQRLPIAEDVQDRPGQEQQVADAAGFVRQSKRPWPCSVR